MKGMDFTMNTTMRMNRRISCQSRSIRCSWSSLICHGKVHLKTKTSVLKAGTQDTKCPSTHTSEGASHRQYSVKYANCV